HGAAPETPVAIVENASRPEQKVVAATLETAPAALAEAGVRGPAIVFIGLTPRRAGAAAAALAGAAATAAAGATAGGA
ncbi:MAG: hypothetical protein AAFR16_12775, partial [Pseudomonadota bacterium]